MSALNATRCRRLPEPYAGRGSGEGFGVDYYLVIIVVGLRRRAQRDDLSGGIRDLTEIQDLESVFRGASDNGNFVTGLQFMAVPSKADQVIRAGHFHRPLHDLTLIILDVE